MRSSILAIVVLLAGLNAFGQAPQPFDVAAAGLDTGCILVLAPPPIPGLEFLGISLDDDTDIRFIAAGGSGRVLGLSNPGSRIFEIRPDLTRTPVFSGIDGTLGGSFVVDAAGNIYLSTDGNRLFAIRPDGTIRAEYAVSMYSMDLAADQCTLFYSTLDGIGRFDVCTGTALPDFLTGSPASDFKLLPDGGLLRSYISTVFRYDAAGTLTRTYPLVELGGVVALGRSGRTMFAGGSCTLVGEYDLDTGALLRTFSFDFDSVTQLVAYDGFTAALGPLAAAHVAAAVPSLSTTMLFVLGALLALIAVRRLM